MKQTMFYDTQRQRIVTVGPEAPRLARRRRYQQVQVPDGTVDEIVDWVGEDQDRRAMALAVEQAGKNRSTLIEALS